MSEIQDLWNKVAEIDYSPVISNTEKTLALEIAACLHELNVSTNAELIELGSGSGKLSSVLAEQGHRTSLMDFCPNALEKSRDYFAARNIPGEFILGNIFNVKETLQKKYEVTWNSGVMEHFHEEDLLTLFKAIHSVTQKYYLCIVPNPVSLPYLLFRFKAMKTGKWLYGQEFLREDYEQIAEQAGFRLVQKKYLGMEFTQEYMHYFFGEQGIADYREFIANGLSPARESYLLMYVFAVQNEQPNILSTSFSISEIKTLMFDYVTAFLKNNTPSIEKLEEQINENHLLRKQFENEKKDLIEQYENKRLSKKLIALKNNLKKKISITKLKPIFKLPKYLRTTFIASYPLVKKYGFLFIFSFFIKKCRSVGLYQTLRFIVAKSKLGSPQKQEVQNYPFANCKVSLEHTFSILKRLEINQIIKGILFIDSAFDYDEERNQRSIALAKSFASQGYFVFFLRYQWNQWDSSEQDYNLFYDRILQVPRLNLKHLLANERFANSMLEKHLIVTIPDEFMCHQYINFRGNNFHIIYDILDNWEEFNLHDSAPWYNEKIEQFFINNSDTVTAVSNALVTKFSSQRVIKLVSNGVFGTTNFLPRLLNKGEYKVGYFGHLTEKWFNWELIFQIAEDERFHIYIIGEGASFENLEKIKCYTNIHYFGYVPQPDLVELVKKFDVGLVPFKLSKLSASVDPLKVYEYLQFGRPVVSMGMPHLAQYPYCYDTIDLEQFKNAIINAIDNTNMDYNETHQFLTNHNWSKKCSDLLMDYYEQEH